ncbi:UNVERIFIED_CONTAM: hypothetical protein PYX00_006857 [Menopon gallinae]|uniref:Alpha-and gamma-adaptin-binding protein p34 n=1 Tax=Menopon gallinae TaxID=328185 RepID=A0AAW2HWW0_9NEOP
MDAVRRDGDTSEKIVINDDIDAYPYHIDNKYYTTDINLCCLKRKVISNETFASTVQGTVIYFDSTKSDCLNTVEGWLPFLNEYQLDIKMLVCKNCLEETTEGCSKRVVQEWCISKGYELIELEPIQDDEDVDDDFPETTGVNRIIQAMNAHVWPNLVMKMAKKPGSGENRIDTELSSLANQLSLEESLEELLENDDFSHLFSQLHELKARVSAMEGPDRLSAAVQIIEAFWKAMDNAPEGEDILDL